MHRKTALFITLTLFLFVSACTNIAEIKPEATTIPTSEQNQATLSPNLSSPEPESTEPEPVEAEQADTFLFNFDNDQAAKLCQPFASKPAQLFPILNGKAFTSLSEAPETLFQLDLQTMEATPIAKSVYENGFIDQVQANGNWAVYFDLNDPVATTEWKLVAVDLATQEKQVVLEPTGRDIYQRQKFLYLMDNVVYISMLKMHEDETAGDYESTRILRYDLKEKHLETLVEKIYEGKYFGHLVATNDLLIVESLGLEKTSPAELYAYSLPGMDLKVVKPERYQGSLALQTPFLAWKNDSSQPVTSEFSLSNIEAWEENAHAFSPVDDLHGQLAFFENTILLTERITYPTTGLAIVLFEPDQGRFSMLAHESPYMVFENPVVNEGKLYWTFMTNAESANPSYHLCTMEIDDLFEQMTPIDLKQAPPQPTMPPGEV